jgi:peptidoglycan/LPS O-acetylase OafA/YrhL
MLEDEKGRGAVVPGEAAPTRALRSVGSGGTDGKREPDALADAHGKDRVNSLDGVRTIAVLAVLMVHGGFPGAELGWLGVDIFFVLSGFLITTLLCKERQRTGTISLPKFWGRRFLRLMPAYWLYVGSMTLWMLLDSNSLSTEGGFTPGIYIASLWGYFVNYVPMGGIWTHQYLTVHLWSLAVEEQFYLLWPFVAYFAFRLRRPWLVAWAAVALVLVRRQFAEGDQEVGALLSTRGIGIILGSAVAMSLAGVGRPAWLQSTRLRSALIALAGVAFAALTVVHRQGWMSELEMKEWCVTWLCVLFVAIVAMLWYGPADRVTSVLSSRPMAYLGQISYGLYLYHLLAQKFVWEVLLPGLEHWNQYARYGLRFALYVALTVVIASLSYQLIEKRFLALKDRLR